MRTRLLWASAACASLLAPAGCGEVDQCTEGEDGCVAGLPLEDNTCRFDLVVDPVREVCTTPEHVSSEDPEQEVTGPPLPNPCNCGVNQVCQSDGSCVDLCLVPSAVTPKTSLLACRSKSYSFQEAAVAWCTQSCVRRAILCGEPCDPATACTPALAPGLLAAADPTCLSNPECAMARCEEVRDRPCAMQQCANPSALDCASVTCQDTCKADDDSEDDLTKDGFCDDGDVSNAVSAICPWGSDCGDCGPRRGAAPAAVKKLGEQCIDPFQCGAPYQDFSNVPAWCVGVGGGSKIEHCVPDCTLEPHSCPPTFECRKIGYKDPNTGKEQNIRDAADLVARACVPTMCGG